MATAEIVSAAWPEHCSLVHALYTVVSLGPLLVHLLPLLSFTAAAALARLLLELHVAATSFLPLGQSTLAEPPAEFS
jgi:hypothetical protein